MMRLRQSFPTATWIACGCCLIIALAQLGLAEQSESTRAIGVVRAAAPPYEEGLYAAEMQGVEHLLAKVTPSGEVEDVTVVHSVGDGRADEVCVTFAKKWLFEPSADARSVPIFFEFTLLPEDTPAEDLGTLFKRPTTVEIRAKLPRRLMYVHPDVLREKIEKEPQKPPLQERD